MTEEQYNKLTREIIASAIEVHKQLGPGLLESVYENCLLHEFKARGINVQNQVQLPLYYKGEKLDKHFVLDLLVEDSVIVELKAVEDILPVHEVQLVTYLKLSGKKLGLLINFNASVLKHGIRRRINGIL
ncbi:GxxExxY protein [Marinilabiliaceae bacterium JC017]|nr:GxxExxY protein [Marinilabiliaceae bacterium JC017]